jgi:hypothetical protein
MRQKRSFGVVLLAICTLGAVVAASAFAARGEKTPEINPIGLFTDETAPGTEPAVIGKGIFKGVGEVKCKDVLSTGGFQTSLLGTFDRLWVGCLVSEVLLLLCTGLNATEESSVLVLGTFHLRYLNSEKKKAVMAYLLIPVHFTCVNGSTKILLEVKGCLAGEIGPINTVIELPKFYQNTFKKVSGTTRNEITRIENEAGNGEEECALESHEGTGAYASFAVTMTDNIYPSTTTSEIIT